jgi:undecaprenyl-diphosphatase
MSAAAANGAAERFHFARRQGKGRPFVWGAKPMDLSWFVLFESIVLGMVEGLTEFLPVSSEGHLLLLRRLLGPDQRGFDEAFTALTELGALMALLTIYRARIGKIARGLRSDGAARHFALGLFAAWLPAAIIGALAHDRIASSLLNLSIVGFALIAGGAFLLWIDRVWGKPRYRDATAFPLPVCLAVGLAQCLALVPGVSRPGAIIIAAVLLGSDKRAAADYALWLAMPTLAGILARDLVSGRAAFSASGALLGAVGFAAAFLTAWPVARAFPDYVARHGLALFAWWRVLAGTAALMLLLIG